MDPKLKALQTKWYARLARAGFDDIEKVLPDGEQVFKSSTFTRVLQTHKRNGNQPEHIEEFYRLAGQFLNEHAFRGSFWQRDRMVWKLYSDGYKANEISKITELGRYRVAQCLKRVSKEFQKWRLSSGPPE